MVLLATSLNTKHSVKREVKRAWWRWRLSRRWSKAEPPGLGPGEREEAPCRVSSSWSRCSTWPLSSAEAQGGRLAHVGKRAAWAREAHTPPSSPPWDRTRLLRAAQLLGPVGRARCSHTLRTLPGPDRRRLLLPGSCRGGAEGERGCAERAGRGLSAVGGRERASERASDGKSETFLCSS